VCEKRKLIHFVFSYLVSNSFNIWLTQYKATAPVQIIR
jgi:hypothetical protein